MESNLVIGNWKMALNLQETERLALTICQNLKSEKTGKTDVIFCPSATYLKNVGEIIKKEKSHVLLGAQNVFWQEKGAFTGEVSVLMLEELGVRYVIIGHSERRINLKETDEMINKKIKLALDYYLVPIVCVGENIEEKNSGQGENVVRKQIAGAFKDLVLNNKLEVVVAYEPVWAIGSGQAAKPDDAAAMNLVIKEELSKVLGKNLIDQKIKIIYGGSVDSGNVKEFLEKNINGFLIGGASLKADEFIKIIKLTSISHVNSH